MSNSRVAAEQTTQENTYDPISLSGGKGRKKAQGGALMNDISNLAVPFAILLAKQGLQHMYKKDKLEEGKTAKSKSAKSAKEAKSAKSAKETKSRRKSSVRAVSGGSCGSQCASSQQSGGNPKSIKEVQNRFKKISEDIDQFLRTH